MNQETNRLGKGLSALISTDSYANSSSYIEKFDIEKISANPYQPRMNISPDELIELSDSIREHGIIQPLIITADKNNNDKYFLIAGERRFRAAQLAGFKTVPVVIKDTSPLEMLELALIENIQRKDLNPIEEGLAFKQLQDEFGLTHEIISKKVGMSRVAITNKIRILAHSDEVKSMVLNNELSEGHARALLGLTDISSAIATAKIVVKRGLSVRETEDLVRKINFGKPTAKKSIDLLSQEDKDIISKFSKKIGYTANVVKLNTGGKIVIRFLNDKEFKDIMGKLV
ncbi:MAG TPA: ParB/RepB/Spo0J family partition protein [Candidatus Dojkabacteria bacterium]|nr:ParB/RepB/Spo0J family partition protein [Candidatus Dojkabacteria bacterium]HQG57910.1 ParB/RepB/Spo0J family partition protein [Candidatus Dojkabacteria bacterium]